MEKITIQVQVQADIKKVWEYWNNPIYITKWAFASDDWHAPKAENNLKVGGKFKIRMEAKDKSSGFNFDGTYTNIKDKELIEYDMPDKNVRHVKTTFVKTDNGVIITTVFDSEEENPIEMQKVGWLAILNNFKICVEKK